MRDPIHRPLERARDEAVQAPCRDRQPCVHPRGSSCRRRRPSRRGPPRGLARAGGCLRALSRASLPGSGASGPRTSDLHPPGECGRARCERVRATADCAGGGRRRPEPAPLAHKRRARAVAARAARILMQDVRRSHRMAWDTLEYPRLRACGRRAWRLPRAAATASDRTRTPPKP